MYSSGGDAALEVFVELAERLLHVAVGQVALEEHIERGVRVDFHQPRAHLRVDQDVETYYVEVLSLCVVKTQPALVVKVD